MSGLLTFANGATSMITGIEGLIFGGQDLYQDSTVEVTIGTVVVFFAALVLLIIASPLEVLALIPDGALLIKRTRDEFC